MDKLHPNPGPGYRIKKRIGRGRWKTAYSAWSQSHPTDVALLCFHAATPDVIATDASALLRLNRSHQYSAYLTKFSSIFEGEDGRLWILEELLDRSLARESPLHEAGRLSTIARDLCRALACLHGQGYVHKDVKLDNCGLDHGDTAKIFDLGSISHEGVGRPHTIVSRAPELLAEGGSDPDASVNYTKAADVWALGATLLALRTGHYPFVYEADVAERATLNRKVADNEITPEDARERKIRLDSTVVARATARTAQDKIRKEVGRIFNGDVRDLFMDMLAFGTRPTIEECDQRWTAIAAAHLSKRAVALPAKASWRQILEAVVRGDLSATSGQIERVARSLAGPGSLSKAERSDLAKIAQKAREVVATRTDAKRQQFSQLEADLPDVGVES